MNTSIISNFNIQVGRLYVNILTIVMEKINQHSANIILFTFSLVISDVTIT